MNAGLAWPEIKYKKHKRNMTDPTSSDAESTHPAEQVAPLRAVRLLASLAGKLNLADFQNAVPMLKSLSIENDTTEALREVDLWISATPAFVKAKVWRVESVAPGETRNLADLDVQLDGPFLNLLTEAERATVTFTLRPRADESICIATLDCSVELLPRNQWGGLSHMPDLVAAFVQPNDPAVDRLLKQAAEVLRKNGKNPALDGYAGGSKRAWELTSAIWSATAGLGLDYALPPASFEHAGQKVRGTSQVVEAGLATCLDLALMFCSALEQAGLNPVLVFTKGHAFAGLWLKADQFTTTVVDDITALRKRLKLKEIVVFEATLATQRPCPSFTYATQRGAEQLAEAVEETFELAVDIRRARLQRVKPLASAEPSAVMPPTEQPMASEPVFDNAPDLPDEAKVEPDPATLNPKDRLARWQRKLLDLSLRNNLLNFKGGKKSLKLEAPDASLLEDVLADGQILKILPRPDLMDGADPRNQAIYESREHENVRRAHALDALKRKEVFVGALKDDLEARLVELFRTARTTLQEGGSNTLYLALGFLSWTRDDRVGQKYRAPLILVPVTLSRKSARSGFTLAIHDDEPRFNPTLIEMLRQDFSLNLGMAEGDLPKDESGLNVPAVWKAVSHAIKDIKGWEVSEEVVLAMFSFAKYLMWKDLTERTDQLRGNAVVRHLIDSPRDHFPSGVAFPNPRNLDREFGPEQTFCPLPADSSQLSAVMAAVRGKDFVLIGPPGTGKSQTISNLIAQCLAEGKRVLFVSEKIAALDVVFRRLRDVKLGEFCLELHSSKARKLDVLAQLKNSWEAKGEVDPEIWRAEAQRLKALRDELNGYVERLHHRFANGMTIYQAIGRVVDGEAVPRLGLSWGSANVHDAAAMEAMTGIVERLDVNAKALGYEHLLSHPLADVGHSEWSPKLQQSLVGAAQAVFPVIHMLTTAYDQFSMACGFPLLPTTRQMRGAMGVLARALPAASGHVNWSFAARPDARGVADRLRIGLDNLARHRELSSSLSGPWPPSIVTSCRRGILLVEQRRELHAGLGKPWTEDIVRELEAGLALLEELTKVSARLSVRYGEQVEQLNVASLQREYAKADKAVWPISLIGKRKIKQALEACVTGEGEPEVATDLHTWTRIRALRSEIEAVTIGPAVDGVWAGLKTRTEFVRSALKLQDELNLAKRGLDWTDAGLEPIANGRCGERMAEELKRLRTLRALDAEIASLDGLSAATESMWAGAATRIDLLGAALEFIASRDVVRTSGALAGCHARIVAGECGQTLANDFLALDRRAEVERHLAHQTDLHAATHGLWDGLQTVCAEVERALKFQASVGAAIANLATTPEELAAVTGSLEKLIGNNNALLASTGTVAAAAQAYLSAWLALQPKVDQLSVAGAFSDASKARFGDIELPELERRCQGVVKTESRLNAWCAWRKVRQQALLLGLSGLVAGIENGAVLGGQVRNAFETNYSRWWLNTVVDSEPVIRCFVAAEHEKRIGDFRALEARYTDLTRAWIRATLCADLPQQDTITRNSEWGILRHEMTKKSKHLPLRTLMSSLPTALTKLTPCMLMSPLSIAQYLSADANAFDVVVFDEASQIPVWDAVGAIARGKQVVMVGDPKQLPPTSFFDRAESSSDEEDVEGDLESILDECMGANLPTMKLSWHYRSRHESLIAFSNHRYYDGSLITFPSPVTKDRAVSFHHVAGVYEKGSSRINKPEAHAIVADIVQKLRAPGFVESGLTIGVVTFNTEQQSLIEDLLDNERRRDPSLEHHFAESALEPLFVKNLESVQGDERDIMYFSITYGPDLTGAVSMNFGPMNRTGGERRLNVAITRARQELRVFSSLKPEKMDLARTQARGVRDLKHFLEFAERGNKALAEVTKGSLGGFESPFEEAVASALCSRGWEVHTQIGASSFRVDLAVVHPDARGMYLTGVECDGATYHRSATARDRDMLREQVLRGLGWEIIRVWSTDWWVDRAGTLEKVDIQLKDLLAKSRAQREVRAEQEAARMLAAETISKARDDSASIEPSAVQSDSAGIQVLGAQAAGTGLADESEQTEAEVYARNEPATRSSTFVPLYFMEADPVTAVDAVLPNEFFEVSYNETLNQMIAHVVEKEGPLLDSVLARRIARAHGWQRTGARIQERVISLARNTFKSTEDDAGVFFWPGMAGAAEHSRFRLPSEDARPIDEICIQELVQLAQSVLKVSIGEAAVASMGEQLGLGRIRAAARARLLLAIEIAASSDSLRS